MTVTIHHNPRCGTSRNALALIRERGIEPVIVEYLKTPLTRAQLEALAARMNAHPRDMLRWKESFAAELGLDPAASSADDMLGAMAAHPILMNRPIVVTPRGAKLCRPSETVLEIL